MKRVEEKEIFRLVIKRRALESALESARSTFPAEFIGLFRGEEKTGRGTGGGVKTARLTELIIPPLAQYGDGFSTYSDIFLPLNTRELASFHSHPHPPAAPSRADLNFFSRSSRYHFIACPPFDWRVLAGDGAPCVRAFDSRGNAIAFEVIEK